MNLTGTTRTTETFLLFVNNSAKGDEDFDIDSNPLLWWLFISLGLIALTLNLLVIWLFFADDKVRRQIPNAMAAGNRANIFQEIHYYLHLFQDCLEQIQFLSWQLLEP